MNESIEECFEKGDHLSATSSDDALLKIYSGGEEVFFLCSSS